jgi:hypothetical protein
MHGLGGLFLERVQLIIAVLVLKLILVEAAQRLAVLSWLVRATMLGKIVGSRERFVAQWANVGPLLCVGTHMPFEMF